MEILRRVLLVAGLFAFLWCALIPVEALVRVEVVDFAARQRREPRWSGDADLAEDAYAANLVRDRVSRADPTTWAKVARAAEAVARGLAPDAPFDGRVGRDYGGEALYLGADDGTVRSLDPPLGDGRTVAYVRVAFDGRERWLGASWVRPAYARGLTPSRLLRPLRGVSLWILGAAVAVYALLPRWKRGATTACYHRVRAVVLPDVLGCVLTGMFLALPMFVIPANSPSGRLFDGDWVALTIVSWGMAGFGLAIFGAAAWYATLRFEVDDDAIRRVTLFGDRRIALASIEAVEPVTLRAPRRLVGLGLLLGLWRPALLGQAMILAGRSDAGVELVLRGGERVRVLWTALENTGPLERALAGLPRPASGGPDPSAEAAGTGARPA